MAFLAGLNEYLAQHYAHSIFEEAAGQKVLYCLHLHEHRLLLAAIAENKTYDIIVTTPDGAQQELQKTLVKMLYPIKNNTEIQEQITLDESVQSLGLNPIISARQRNHIKNKNLFPLMREQEPLIITLLEGEILRGCIHSFSQYEIMLTLQNQEQVVILRHAVLDIRNIQKCCFLKSSQQTLRDWTKSGLYIDPIPRSQLRPGLKKTKIKRRQKIIIR